MNGGLLIEVPAGDLIDRITILEIKAARIGDAGKLANVQAELSALSAVWERDVPDSPELRSARDALAAVNLALWEIEDAIRLCERDGDFGPRFVELARSVYRTNDRRAALKREINALTGSRLVEEKSYAPY